MKILVTGGAGFIGSHVVDKYIKEGHSVIVVDDLTTGNKDSLNPKAIFYNCDIRSSELFAIFEKEMPDIVNHHAAQVNVRKSVENPVLDAEVNIIGLLNVLQCSLKFNVKKFIFISSGGAIYGDARQIPTPESSPALPLSPYGLAKDVGENYVKLLNQLHGLQYTILRYGNVYGPRQDPSGEAGVIAIFIGKILKGNSPTIFGDGEQTRDYIFVGDIADVNLLCLENGKNQTFNIGVGKETSVNSLFLILKKQQLFGEDAIHTDKRTGEVFRNCLDNSKAKKLLCWENKTSLEQGIKETIQWFKEKLE